MIATGSWDSDVRLWNVATGKELAMLTGHKASVLNYAFSPDGRTLATKCDDRTIKFWNLETFREVASISLDYTGSIQGNFLAFSPQRKHDAPPCYCGGGPLARTIPGSQRSWHVQPMNSDSYTPLPFRLFRRQDSQTR